MPQLMRSVDATAVHKQTGNTVMHSLACSDRVLEPWMKKLGARLMERGCDINAVNRDGFTPILLAAKSGNASAILMLHSLGADCGAQRAKDGASMLHVLVGWGWYDALLELFSDDAAPGLDLFSVNRAGQTPAEFADSVALPSHHLEAPEWALQVAQLMSLQTELFRKHQSPLIRRVLSEHMLPDLASIVLGYIDGSGPAHPIVAAAEFKENDEE